MSVYRLPNRLGPYSLTKSKKPDISKHHRLRPFFKMDKIEAWPITSDHIKFRQVAEHLSIPFVFFPMFVCEDTSVFPEVSPLKDNLRLHVSRHSTSTSSTASADLLIVSTMRCPSCRWRSRKDLVSRAPFECSDSGDTSSTRIMMHNNILKITNNAS